jgi:hypothetical protein
MLAQISRWTLPTIIVLTALVAYRIAFMNVVEENLSEGRNEPYLIEPQHDIPLMVTDEQLYRVLDRVKPVASPVNTNNYVHALRLWGRNGDFDDAEKYISGEKMWSYFMDDNFFQQMAGSNVPPLFEMTPEGITVRGYDDDYNNFSTSSYHVDDLLATMAESGTSLDTPMIVRNGECQVRDVLNAAMKQFHLSRHEFEWSLISYGRYLYPKKRWHNRYGDKIDVEGMLDEIMTGRLTDGPCNGAHRLEALVVLYRADEQAQAFRPATRQRILAHMKHVSQRLVEAQSVEGYWTKKWPLGLEGSEDETAKKKWPLGLEGSEGETASLSDKILVTGHQLEWLALAPPEVHPPRENLVRASQWLVNAMLEIDEEDLFKRYGPLSHAARALCLWRSKDPYAAWAEGHEVYANQVTVPAAPASEEYESGDSSEPNIELAPKADAPKADASDGAKEVESSESVE